MQLRHRLIRLRYAPRWPDTGRPLPQPTPGSAQVSVARKRLYALLLILVGLAIIVAVVLTRGVARQPVTLLFIGSTNDNTGAQVTYFCLSNRTTRPVVFLGDATGLAYYSLNAELPLANNVILHTNYNQQQFFTVKSATLPPGSGVTFPVRLPREATGAVLRLNYMRQNGWFEERARRIFLRVRGRASEPYQNLELQQPFEQHVVQ